MVKGRWWATKGNCPTDRFVRDSFAFVCMQRAELRARMHRVLLHARGDHARHCRHLLASLYTRVYPEGINLSIPLTSGGSGDVRFEGFRPHNTRAPHWRDQRQGPLAQWVPECWSLKKPLKHEWARARVCV